VDEMDLNVLSQIVPTICQISSNDISQVIGLIGTILGVVIGWILSYISDNKGKIIISTQYSDNKSNSNEYAYNLKMFVLMILLNLNI
jgi:ABC-type transporter Mla maintaining outer membrane lipid asymmetry ATPase subunit MlaF